MVNGLVFVRHGEQLEGECDYIRGNRRDPFDNSLYQYQYCGYDIVL